MEQKNKNKGIVKMDETVRYYRERHISIPRLIQIGARPHWNVTKDQIELAAQYVYPEAPSISQENLGKRVLRTAQFIKAGKYVKLKRLKTTSLMDVETAVEKLEDRTRRKEKETFCWQILFVAMIILFIVAMVEGWAL